MSVQKVSCNAIVLAGGYSRRMSGAMPKQLIKISNQPLLVHTLHVFERCSKIKEVVVVANKKYLNPITALVHNCGYKKIAQICPGGNTRQQSVYNGLAHMVTCEYVLIHDGVRPCINQKIIVDVIKAALKHGAATSAVRATDTIIASDMGYINKALSRDKLWRIQTPQAFLFDLIIRAHQLARRKHISDATDDTQLVIRLGQKVKIVEGSYRNIKVTTKEDLLLAKQFLNKNT